MIKREDLFEFIKTLEKKTASDEIQWTAVNKFRVNNSLEGDFIDRSQNYSKLKDVYETENSNFGMLAFVGKFERKLYYDEDMFEYEDVYFISFKSIADVDYLISYTDEKDLGVNFQVALGKLHRMIQIQTSNLENVLKKWFD